jgi:L-alanine-DL-glutamate epimerase-like enolase superfamily enzyme
MCAAGAVDCLQVDITRCGGTTELLRIAAVAAAHHLEVSGHCAPYQHASAVAAVPNLRHLEYFHDHSRIERAVFHGADAVVDGHLRLSDRPGNGLTFDPRRAAELAGQQPQQPA